MILSGFNPLNSPLSTSSSISLKEAYYLEKLSLQKGFKINYKLSEDSLNLLEKSDLCVLFGGFSNACLNENERWILESINQSKRPYALLRPLQDTRDLQENCLFASYEIHTEAAILALILRGILEKTSSLKGHVLEKIDVGYLSSEANMSEEELQELIALIVKAKKRALVLNREITKHAHSAFLYTLLSGLQNYLEILHIPCNDSSATTAFYDSKDQEWLLETALKEGVLPFESELKDLESLEQISEANGSFVYVSYKSLKTPKLSFSKQFKIANKIQHSKAKFQISNQTLECELEESPNLKGLIAILEGAFFDTYPYIPILSHSQGIS
ncbi:NADH dehydrogenase I subunit F [Helicobacter pylori]|uniref:NADH dehydrogenase I subunit F n=1 Tax=Helicobacter pylori TaxID=210 RepID=A0A238GWC2_HELPX|nr:NADH dehydrogenase I subunit F [Helicobacter pylori]